MTNPYGSQDPYGQPSANDPQQQHDLYGSMTGFSPAQSSQSGSSAAQPSSGAADPYATPNPYDPSVSPYGSYGRTDSAPARPKRSSVLGVISLVLVALGVILSLIMAIVGGGAYASMVDQLGTTQIPDVPPEYLNDEFATFGITFLVYLATALPILAGLIMGIIAIATNRGRVFGIVSTILAILGPIIVFVIFFVIAGPSAIENTPT